MAASYRAAEFAQGFWKGIEVWGEPSMPQTGLDIGSLGPIYQGLVRMRNGGEVRQAEIGILVGSRDEPLAKAGGVVIIEGAVEDPVFNRVMNCQVGVKFEPYAYQDPVTLAWHLNKSKFTRTEFRVDDNYQNSPYFNPQPPGSMIAQAVLDGVRGIQFKGCSFAHILQLTPPTSSSAMGHGIMAHNSTFTVNRSCPAVGPCEGFGGVGSFYGFDHAIRSTGSYGRFSIANTHFTNNACAIYANGQYKLSIVDNTIRVGAANITLNHPDELDWGGYQRGIFLTECGSLSIQGNVLQNNPFVPVGTIDSEGIVVGFTREWNDIIRLNAAERLSHAFVGEGVCASSLGGTEPFLRGLQFVCNTNYQNQVNFRSRTPIGVVPADEEHCTIRLLQGLIVGN